MGKINFLVLIFLSLIICGCSGFYEPKEEDIAQQQDEIVDGTNISHSKFPSIIALFGGGGYCTGTLIQSNLVLTAAHCYSDDMRVVYGEASILDGNNKYIDVLEAVPHPNYNDNTLSNDIMLVLLPYSLGEDVCVPILDANMYSRYLKPGEKVTIAGYGRSAANQEGGILRMANTEVAYIFDKKVAVGGISQPDICFGDSGGPLYVTMDNKTHVTGVASYTQNGDTCNGSVHILPGFYTDWILTTYTEMLSRADMNHVDAGISLNSGECNLAKFPPQPETNDDGCAMVRAGNSSNNVSFIVGILTLGICLVRYETRNIRV